MVAGEGLFVASRLTLRVVACGNAFSLRSNRTWSKLLILPCTGRIWCKREGYNE
ncbi:hypothetical protein AI2711V1_2016 [Raoultella ornithinolytica]|nr:hypothetical protein AI2711V1_2016 [Raoultella ornithinolytica]CAH3465150.1 hypothetical protein AI2711V1_2016 [Raoultella ornithinolytica]